MKINKDTLQTIIALGVIIGMVLSALAYFAKADDLKVVDASLKIYILNNSILSVEQQKGRIEDKPANRGKPVSMWPDPVDRNQYRKLQKIIKQMEEQRKILMKAKGKG